MAKVLLIDDDFSIRSMTKMLLEKGGHVVLEAENGPNGLRILETERPDIIILDIMMLGMTGWQVLGKIMESDDLRDIPVAMFSVKTKEDSHDEILEFKPRAYITKPFDNEDFLEVINELTTR